ncbi:hypothetical protein ACFQ6N_41025, partial [Kitasatospora sp. NPDC056446]
MLTMGGCGGSAPNATFETSPALSDADLKGLYPGTLLRQVVFEDIDGAGLLLISRSEQTSPAQEDKEPLDQITLRAELFRRPSLAAPWTSRWI